VLPPCATSGRLHRRPHRCYGRGGSAAGRIHPCAAASREKRQSGTAGGAALCLCNSSRPDRSRCEDRIAHPRRPLHPRVVKPRDARRWGLRTRREGTPARCRKSSPLGRRGFPRFHDASTAPFGTCPPAAAMAEIPLPKRPPEDAPGRTRTCDPLLRRREHLLRSTAACRSVCAASDGLRIAAAFCCGLSLPPRFHVDRPAFTQSDNEVSELAPHLLFVRCERECRATRDDRIPCRERKCGASSDRSLDDRSRGRVAAPRTCVGLVSPSLAGSAHPDHVPLACKPPVRCKVVRPPQVGRVVLEEHLRHELASTANAGRLEDRLQVVPDRVLRGRHGAGLRALRAGDDRRLRRAPTRDDDPEPGETTCTAACVNTAPGPTS
jgi:hypothetical protein